MMGGWAGGWAGSGAGAVATGAGSGVTSGVSGAGALCTGGSGGCRTDGGSVCRDSERLTGGSLDLKCLVIEYGVIFLKNLLFLRVFRPDPSTVTTY